MNKETERAVTACLEQHRGAPLVGEIGFGNGEFLVHLAKSAPDTLFFGFEVSRTCLLKCQTRAESEKLENIRLIQGDARFLLRECFPDSVFDELYMNFPCPWPKKKHEKRRVTAGDFPDVLASVLKNGGFFEMATDDDVYAGEAEKTLHNHPAIFCESHRINTKRTLTTKYERKWTAEEKTIHVLRFRKKRSWTVERIYKGGSGMHLEYNGPAPDLDTLGQFHDRQGGTKDTSWVFKTSYQGSDGTFLLETMTSDGEFRQHFFMKIIPRARGVLVKLDPATKPFATPSVKKAMQDLVFMLEKGAGQ
ncbi:MAG: tRNA (guanosine(46)-N7)-methyltransferase TrmB [Thermovirgaceae bacterium]